MRRGLWHRFKIRLLFPPYAPIFTDTSKIPYVCVRATAGSAQDWIRRIDNKQSRTRAGNPLSPRAKLPSYRCVSFYRAQGEPPNVDAGCGKSEKKNGRSTRIARRRRWRGRAKGKDLNGLSQKAFSYSPWQTTMAKWREREHILNRFPSSVRDVFMWRTKPARLGPAAVRIYRFDALGEDSLLLSGGESFEFKRFKAISQEGGASDCRPSNTDRPTTRSFLPLALSSSRLIPFRLLSLLSPVPAVTYCDLLTELCYPARKTTVPFGAKNFGQCEKWCGQPAARLVIRLVSPWHVLLESRRLSYVIITFTTCTGCWETAGDITNRIAGKPRRDERGLGRTFHKIPRVICFKRERYVVSGIQCFKTFDGFMSVVPLSFHRVYTSNSAADFITNTRHRNIV